MLINFFFALKKIEVPVTIKELLDLLLALKEHLVYADQEAFYYLARTCLVKDERHYDKFDRAFSAYFEGLDISQASLFDSMIPDEWLRKNLEKLLTKDQMDAVEALGDLDDLMKAFKERLEDQKARHQGGNRWIGTGGTSPFGAYGFNPAGFRIGGDSRHKRAVKVWEKRQFKDLDDSIEIGIRNIKVALKRLRKMTHSGSADHLDIDDTIRSTAKKGGLLDIKMVPERRNSVKVLLFFDVGGSMDPYIKSCEELFSAARSEFKYLEYFYFHNCLYEGVWRNNVRRISEKFSTWDILHKYGQDYKVIFVGDAAMSPYEVSHVGGSVEHWNEESGEVWLQRLVAHFERVVWLNPVAEAQAWDFTLSTQWIKQIFNNEMYSLTLEGLEQAMQSLSR